MKQFTTILGFELKNYYRNKVFVGITILLVAIIGVVMFLPNFFSSNSSGATSEEDKAVMLVYSDDEEILQLALPYFSDAFTKYSVKSFSGDEEKLADEIRAERAECGFIINEYSYKYFVNTLSMHDTNPSVASEILTTVYKLDAMISGGMTPDDANDIMGISVSGETVSIDKSQQDTFLYTYIMIIALYMVIVLYGQMVATSVASEKSSRAMELLITTANPVSMMFGKVFAACIAGLCQLTVIFGSALLFFNLNKGAWAGNMIVESLFNIPPMLLVYMLVFFLLGFLIYAFLYGALGSTVSKLEDLNTAIVPLNYLFIIAFFVVTSAITSGDVKSILIYICSYIPFTSPIAMFTRIAMSAVPLYEIIISISILIASVIGTGFLAAKIYRIGVLLYGTKPNFFKLLKELFKKQS